MLRRFNSTGRQKILNEHAAVRIRAPDDNNARSFELTLDLSSYQFDPEAQVRIVAWRSNVGERWDLGVAGQLSPGAQISKRMHEVPDTSQFRVVVAAGDGSGMLLGATVAIKPKMPVESLIALRPDDLGEEVWRVSFGDDDMPELLVNNKIEMMSEIVRSDAAFRALVMPQVLRTVLTQIMFVLGGDSDDNEEPWYLGWFHLAQSLLPGEIPKIADHDDSSQQAAAQAWIEQVVHAFAMAKVNAAEQYRGAQQAAS